MSKKKKKIAYVSGTRADYGLMTSILKAIDKSPKLELSLYATGIHLMPKFGETAKDVKGEFSQTKRIPAVFESDDRLGMAKFSGEFLQKLVNEFNKNRPDFVLTLGDRPEMLAVAVACLYLGIPTGQISAGDRSFTVDELARHAITKLSYLHFPATKEAANRVIKMGEEAWRVHTVGAPGLDVILNEKLPSRKEVENYLNLKPGGKFILLTQHPVSEEWRESGKQIKETLAALKKFKFPIVATYPHADAGGLKIIKVLEKEKTNPLFRIFPNVPYKMFLALQREAAVWVGNSSGAIVESSSFKTPVVNIGIRQLGRQHGDNVINVGYNSREIAVAIEKSLHNNKYLKKLSAIKNPYGDGRTTKRVIRVLEQLKLNVALLKKQITY
ncbi:MAG: UDP-N-acetyl-D-glucosamine 2-epimerase, UDP-hydrolysing [Candidatus Harrisonbacteria bacterium RIFCSPLOWO2_02_FULL_41_11]|uniref:UDP-N-acetyl-D-glucosamine 2-epimerase, UDP-hydrolysing n=1 Tax=Candidatus Harrisonbacteria bacterium RIFCSPHIGHO2_02_FULL_42_16 TaxID=1798404 RepID=A0A1G1ZG68_9BACT|nr:MAG: UDP-N-acetyl-D-glucosamine 2-epimerase, UDP-hydrolysing [Candidatus Harrisonbacteria bacterium RIFCSPHIGHO2_02_FULL_42_16]OGY65642.1 MAG: UDP-N-acetyl-D-glucosamine 2-epimerase, UDP-hydrolysing [Candidatus Harrisonbacteria bacterium RIFCSPLOWO2_02_FULL_41_11]